MAKIAHTALTFEKQFFRTAALWLWAKKGCADPNLHLLECDLGDLDYRTELTMIIKEWKENGRSTSNQPTI